MRLEANGWCRGQGHGITMSFSGAPAWLGSGMFMLQGALQAPEGAPASSGVVVEQGESCLYVKVNCRDRRGLLGDIILALKAMPLEVRRVCCWVQCRLQLITGSSMRKHDLSNVDMRAECYALLCR